MSAYSITYKVSSAHVPVYILTCPPVHSKGMIGYLRKNGCKFHMVMERTKWERRHSVDRDVFYIEVCPQQVADRLIASTQSKGGQVNLPAMKLVSPNASGIEVSLVICTETQEQVLEILFKGSEIPATGDDEDDYEWWNAQNNLDIKLKTFIETAITGKQNLVFYYDARINAGLADLLESCGFTYDGTEEAMRFSNK